jgi:glycosyltransferase involved in cell wall biosynthesis
MTGPRSRRSTSAGGPALCSELRVLVVAPFPYGIDRGSPIRARRGVSLAMRAGAAVTVVTYGANLPDDPIVIRGPMRVRSMRQGFSKQKPLLDLVLLYDVVRVARRTRPDVIHAHVHEGLAVALVARLFARGSRVVYDAHGTLAEELAIAHVLRSGGRAYNVVRRFEQWLVRRADAVLAQSQHRADELVRDGVKPDRVTVLPDSPEPALFEVGRDRSRASARSGESVLVVYTGSLETYQGIDDIIAAAQSTTGIRFVLFGEPGGRYQDDIKARGLSDRMDVIDPAPFAELPALLARADIALAPRHYGGNIPGKVPAYLAAGVPVIGTDVDGIREIVDDSVGAIVPPGDVSALIDAIRRLAGDPAGLHERSLNATGRATGLYGEQAMMEALRAAYGCAA